VKEGLLLRKTRRPANRTMRGLAGAHLPGSSSMSATGSVAESARRVCLEAEPVRRVDVLPERALDAPLEGVQLAGSLNFEASMMPTEANTVAPESASEQPERREERVDPEAAVAADEDDRRRLARVGRSDDGSSTDGRFVSASSSLRKSPWTRS